MSDIQHFLNVYRQLVVLKVDKVGNLSSTIPCPSISWAVTFSVMGPAELFSLPDYLADTIWVTVTFDPVHGDQGDG